MKNQRRLPTLNCANQIVSLIAGDSVTARDLVCSVHKSYSKVDCQLPHPICARCVPQEELASQIRKSISTIARKLRRLKKLLASKFSQP